MLNSIGPRPDVLFYALILFNLVKVYTYFEFFFFSYLFQFFFLIYTGWILSYVCLLSKLSIHILYRIHRVNKFECVKQNLAQFEKKSIKLIFF